MTPQASRNCVSRPNTTTRTIEIQLAFAISLLGFAGFPPTNS
jgi:hypothetical protein